MRGTAFSKANGSSDARISYISRTPSAVKLRIRAPRTGSRSTKPLGPATTRHHIPGSWILRMLRPTRLPPKAPGVGADLGRMSSLVRSAALWPSGSCALVSPLPPKILLSYMKCYIVGRRRSRWWGRRAYLPAGRSEGLAFVGVGNCGAAKGGRGEDQVVWARLLQAGGGRHLRRYRSVQTGGFGPRTHARAGRPGGYELGHGRVPLRGVHDTRRPALSERAGGHWRGRRRGVRREVRNVPGQGECGAQRRSGRERQYRFELGE